MENRAVSKMATEIPTPGFVLMCTCVSRTVLNREQGNLSQITKAFCIVYWLRTYRGVTAEKV